MSEAVRLVVWDLDETFWKGTLTEGGITEYVTSHHNTVIELAKRGILSSICSKNDPDKVVPILKEYGIFDYFVFPSISWEPKGVRLAQLVDTVQLRAPTVMFIDDNAHNRAEARDVVPGLQVEDEHFIAKILSDPRFKGKDDLSLSRLNQYKLLEQRKRDEQTHSGGNEEFLRGCDIRVYIEHDVVPHIDRVIELINRTNQLNYTKHRLPEDPTAARRAVLEKINDYDRQAGLVRVVDKYGDYGWVGYFERINGRETKIAGAADARLLHFCFSCRTLGMFVEQWVYEHLRRPELKVVGEVLTDLNVPRSLDWIREVQSLESSDAVGRNVAPQIIAAGGCEMESVGVYLGSETKKLSVVGNFTADKIFVHMNSAILLLDRCNRGGAEFAAECERLALPYGFLAGDIFANAEPGAAFVINVSRDAHKTGHYRHKIHGWKLMLQVFNLEGLLIATSDEDLERRAESYATRAPASMYKELKAHALKVMRHMTDNYEFVPTDEKDGAAAAREMLGRVPTGSKLIFAMNHWERREPNGEIVAMPETKAYPATLREITANCEFAAVVSFSDIVKSHDEIYVGYNHYHREVFLRFSQLASEVILGLKPKA